SELELSAATLEQTSERLLEQVVDDVEGFLESLFAFPIHVPDSALEFGQCRLDVDLLVIEFGKATLGILVLGLGIEVYRSHPIDELRQFIDAAAMFRIRRRPSMEISHHARQLQTAESLPHAFLQVFSLQVEALQLHLVTA